MNSTNSAILRDLAIAIGALAIGAVAITYLVTGAYANGRYAYEGGAAIDTRTGSHCIPDSPSARETLNSRRDVRICGTGLLDR